jgi:ketosteroid isomerase-like protein
MRSRVVRSFAAADSPNTSLKRSCTNFQAYVDGDTTIAELHSTSKTKEGADFANDYCWVCRFEGDIIVEVRAHVDSMMVAYTVLRNEGRRC